MNCTIVHFCFAILAFESRPALKDPILHFGFRSSKMPTIFRYKGFRFFFYSNEGDPREPIHVHVQKGEAEAKFWIGAEVTLAYSHLFDAGTIHELMEVTEKHRGKIETSWNEHFA
jgi:hypothetical protein